MSIKYLLLAGISVLAFASCDKLFVLQERDGQPIMFSASAEYGEETGDAGEVGTKTEYSGYVRNNKERIDWVDGDQVKIFLHTHNSGSNSNSRVDDKDYYIVQINPDDTKSKARVASVSEPLAWQANRVHDFYSFYPADAITANDGSFGSNGAKFTVTLPEEQDGDLATNMRHAYMAAAKKGYQSTDKGQVTLDYYPMVTTIFVTIRNNCASHEPIDIRKVGLKHTHKFNNGASENEKRPYYLSGTYDLQTNGSERFSYNSSNFRNGSTYVGATFEPNSVAYGESVSCALFLLPQSFNANDLKLTVRTTKSVVANTLGNSKVSTFQAGKKYNLNIAINEKDVLVSDVEISDHSTQLVAKMLLEQIINFSDLTVAAVLDDVTGVYPGSGTCEIVDGKIKVLVDDDNGTRVWRDLTDDEVRYLASTVTTIDLHESLFQPGTKLTVEDFAIFCNLEKINFLNLNNVTELDLSGMEKLQEVQFHHGGEIRIEDCPSLQRITLDNIAGAKSVTFKNLPAMTSFSFTGNGAEQAQDTEFEFIDMGGLQTIEFERVKSVTANNCPELTTLTIRTPADKTKAITIIDAPKFRSGNIGRQRDYVSDTKINVTLTNCSANASGSPQFNLYYRDSGRHPVYSITNSSRLAIRNHRWDYGRNRDVVDSNLQ